jgi:TRAP-type C4-dicarboxylate transport system substrate-binding protein
MKFICKVVACCFALASIVICFEPTKAFAGEVKVGSFVSAKGFGSRFVIMPWMKRAREDLTKIGSKTTIKAYWGGSLGKSPFQQYDLVKGGVADVAWVMPGYTPGQFPELEIVEIPFLFRTANEAAVVTWHLYEKGLLSGFQDTHLVGMFAGAPAGIFSRDPITRLEDLKNRKVRIVGATQGDWLRTLGGVPERASSRKMNEKLNRGTFSAVMQGWSGMKTFKSFGLVNHTVDVPVGTLGFMLLMNKNTWNGFSAGEKKAIQENGGIKIAKDSGRAYAKAAKDIRVMIKKQGKHKMITFTQSQLNAYEKAAQPVHQRWANKNAANRKAYDATIAMLTKMRSGS